MTADEIIAALRLQPHPEGGHYRETWRADAAEGARPTGTAIYFLLRRGERSHWHRVDAVEIWLHHAGAPLHLWLSPTDEGPTRRVTLGPDLVTGARPQALVEAGHWQAAATTGDWSLVSCVVSPGFVFEGFTLAPPDFDIPAAR
ncbi:MAG: cupin domain-containing protein [Rhodobacteraceae bacterium]|nr:cupin domain-containing protein [Paracoccaceae bacterium]